MSTWVDNSQQVASEVASSKQTFLIRDLQHDDTYTASASPETGASVMVSITGTGALLVAMSTALWATAHISVFP